MNKESILSAIRRYIFDNYPTHVLTLGEVAGCRLSLSSTKLLLVKEATPDTPFLDVDITGKTFGNLLEELIGKNIPIAYTASYRSDEPIDSVISMTETDMGDEVKLYTKVFYSDRSIMDFVKLYLSGFMGYPRTMTDEDVDTLLESFTGRTFDHLTLYVAILLVDYRRVFAYTQGVFDGSTFNDGTGKDIGGQLSADLDNISVTIGNVFNLSDSGDLQKLYPTSDNGTAIGSENFFGDVNSIWYKLFLWLRDKLEQGFSDFTFRKNNGMWTRATLDRPLSYFQYFDSYPYSEQTQQIRTGLS